MSAKEYVVVTDWQPRRGGARRRIVHVYGLYTESRARAERLRMLAKMPPEEGTFEVRAMKLIDIDALNAALK